MASSGTYTFSPTNSTINEEAYRRIKITPDMLTAEHMEEARFSMNLLFVEWETRGVKQYKVEQFTLTTTQSDYDITLNARVLEILQAVYRDSDSADTPMHNIGRQEYLFIHDKDIEGTPDRYFLDKQTAAPILYDWPAPDTASESIVIDAIVATQDVGTAQQNPDVSRIWYEALCAGLAAKLAEKYSDADMETRMFMKADRAFNLAKTFGRERGDTVMTVNYGRGRR